MNDSQHNASWDSDPGTHPRTPKIGASPHVEVITDDVPEISSSVDAGILNDGSAVWEYEWGTFWRTLVTC